MTRFTSKRNDVIALGGIVLKRARSAAMASQEAEILQGLRAHGVAVPEVIARRGDVLVLERLPGEPLPDWIERGDYDPDALAKALCDWLGAFYAAMPDEQIRGDVNGRNFLSAVPQGQSGSYVIYGVDFEERCYGPRARDAGRLAAFIETYRTREPAKQEVLAESFMRAFAARFDCTLEDILAERELEYAAMHQRRKA